MASRVKLLIISLIIYCYISMIKCNISFEDKQIDSEPSDLGINGDETQSAKHGWKVLWDDISKSLMSTKFLQSKEGKTRNAIKNLISKPNVSQKSTYSPKRSSKCVFGTPYPQNYCGPDFVTKIHTKEYKEFAQRLWKSYLMKNMFNY